MYIAAFLTWWYTEGWSDAANRIRARIRSLYLELSVDMLLRTLFAPWRRITTPPGTSLGDHVRAWLDNLVSRCVGAAVRLITLGIALGGMTALAIGGGIWLVLWPILPALGPALIIIGLVVWPR